MSQPKPQSYTATRRVEFHHTDAAGIIHFSRYFLYMEEAEHEFLRHLGLGVMMHEGGQLLSWPRVACRCDFTGVVKFEDTVEITVTVEKVGEKSVTYNFAFTHNGRDVARGSTTAVCCRLEEGKKPESVKIPDHVRKKLTG